VKTIQGQKLSFIFGVEEKRENGAGGIPEKTFV
jgi:hypothetical protein